MCRRRFLTIVLPLHRLGELLHCTSWLVVQFLGPTSSGQPKPTQNMVAQVFLAWLWVVASFAIIVAVESVRIVLRASARLEEFLGFFLRSEIAAIHI